MLLSGNGYYQLAHGNYVGGLIIKYHRSHRPNHRISVHIIGQDNKRKNYTISYSNPFDVYHHFYIKNTVPIILGCTFGEKYPIRPGWKGREVMPIWGREDTLSSHQKCFSPAIKSFCIRLYLGRTSQTKLTVILYVTVTVILYVSLVPSCVLFYLISFSIIPRGNVDCKSAFSLKFKVGFPIQPGQWGVKSNQSHLEEGRTPSHCFLTAPFSPAKS